MIPITSVTPLSTISGADSSLPRRLAVEPFRSLDRIGHPFGSSLVSDAAESELSVGPVLRSSGRSSREYRGAVRLDGYRFGRVLVDGEEHTKDLIVLPNRVVGEWWRRDGHSLVLEDPEDVLDELPERLILGTGAYGRLQPDPGALEQLRAARSRSRACPRPMPRAFGQLDPARTAAALHLTC